MIAPTVTRPEAPGGGGPARSGPDGVIRALRLGPVSVRVDRRAVVVTVGLAVAVLVAAVWSLGVGDVSVAPGDVLAHLSGRSTSRRVALVLSTFRTPRVACGVLVGAALGASGQILQRLVRNPLASPDILGVSAGASVAAVAGIVVWSLTGAGPTFVALIGSVAAVAAIYLLAVKEGVSSYRLVLVGIGLTSMLEATIAYLLTRAQVNDAQRAAVWMTGSLNGRGWEHVVPLAVALAVLAPVALVSVRVLRALELGDDCARGLGVGLGRAKLAVALAGAALAGVATAAAGPVAFVALVAPQIARRVAGGRSAAVVPAALVGALMLVVADTVARRIVAPTELPVGVVTAVIGAPVLLWLLARGNRLGTGG